MGGTNDDFCSPWADRRVFITAALAIVCPLSLIRNIDALKYTSLFALLAITYLTVIVVVRSGETLRGEFTVDDVSFAEISEDIFRAFPIVTLAYTCQFNLFPIISSLRKPTRRRIKAFVGLSLTSCFVVYCIIGTFGYLTFTGGVQGNVLLNYDPGDPFITVGRIAVALVIMFSYPLLAHACFGTVDEMLFDREQWDFSYCRRAGIMAVLAGSQYVMAMFVPDISVPLGIAGPTGSTSISFILPALFYLKLSNAPAGSCHKVMATILLLLGCMFLVASTTVTLIGASMEDEEDLDLGFVCNKTLQRLERNQTTSDGWWDSLQ